MLLEGIVVGVVIALVLLGVIGLLLDKALKLKPGCSVCLLYLVVGLVGLCLLYVLFLYMREEGTWERADVAGLILFLCLFVTAAILGTFVVISLVTGLGFLVVHCRTPQWYPLNVGDYGLSQRRGNFSFRVKLRVHGAEILSERVDLDDESSKRSFTGHADEQGCIAEEVANDLETLLLEIRRSITSAARPNE